MARRDTPKSFDDLQAESMARVERQVRDRQEARIEALERAFRTTKINWDEEAQKVEDENPTASYRQSLTADLDRMLKKADLEYEKARRDGAIDRMKPENE